MIRRRELLGAAGASLVLGSTLKSEVARAAERIESIVPGALSATRPRGAEGRLARMASLHLESQQDFTLGFRLMHARAIKNASMNAFDRVLEREGIDPAAPLTIDDIRRLIELDPMINVASKTWLANQRITWKTLLDYYHANSDFYLTQLAEADRAGPGRLELAPSMNIPDYARHEIHIQPGGYVGDPFMGYVYHYGTNSFYISVMGHNEQDEVHRRVVSKLPVPADGKVRRILDMGCGIGQFTVALKERFPDAEVWGIDVGAPMIRYAHYRANELKNGANFAQRLASDTKFPSGHFDLVTSYIMHHEMPAAITRDVIAEAQRITRPGGVFYPIDFNSGGTKGPAHGMYGRWWDHRWNNEVWSLDYHSIDFSSEIASRGFSAAKNPAVALPGFGVRHFIRA